MIRFVLSKVHVPSKVLSYESNLLSYESTSDKNAFNTITTRVRVHVQRCTRVHKVVQLVFSKIDTVEYESTTCTCTVRNSSVHVQ